MIGANIKHIARHDILPSEVEEAYENEPLDLDYDFADGEKSGLVPDTPTAFGCRWLFGQCAAIWYALLPREMRIGECNQLIAG